MPGHKLRTHFITHSYSRAGRGGAGVPTALPVTPARAPHKMLWLRTLRQVLFSLHKCATIRNNSRLERNETSGHRFHFGAPPPLSQTCVLLLRFTIKTQRLLTTGANCSKSRARLFGDEDESATKVHRFARRHLTVQRG